MEMKRRVSIPEIVAITLLSILMLLAGVLIAGQYGDFRMRGEPGSASLFSSESMPAGMVMSRTGTRAQMLDMSAVDASKITYIAPDNARGDEPLKPDIENGVKIFRLETSLIGWHILKGTTVGAYAYNKTVPGPLIRVNQGDRLRVIVTNHLLEPTSVHWHGLILPNSMDGAPPFTPKPISPGRTFIYEFTASQAGTYFYHSHVNPDRQEALGLYGALIIELGSPNRTLV